MHVNNRRECKRERETGNRWSIRYSRLCRGALRRNTCIPTSIFSKVGLAASVCWGGRVVNTTLVWNRWWSLVLVCRRSSASVWHSQRRRCLATRGNLRVHEPPVASTARRKYWELTPCTRLRAHHLRKFAAATTPTHHRLVGWFHRQQLASYPTYIHPPTTALPSEFSFNFHTVQNPRSLLSCLLTPPLWPS